MSDSAMLRTRYCGQRVEAGSADRAVEQTELPQEYLELEKRIDQLKLAHLKLLNVTYLLLACAILTRQQPDLHK